MKKILTVILLLTGVSMVNAQATLTTKGAEACWWNYQEKAFIDNCSSSPNVITRLWMNKSETMFIHYTGGDANKFYVTSTEHRIEEEKFMYNARDEAGNVFAIMIDAGNSTLKFMQMGEDVLLLYGIVDYQED
jgi:hypothetical protein